MKGNEKVIAMLNGLLKAEITAISQYIVHAEMCDNWDYKRLHEIIEKRAIDEMKHAEKLIGRILFLEGIPIVNKLDKINIGATVDKQVANDWEAENVAIKDYNEGVRLSVELKDNGTREMLDDILKDEEHHIDTIESFKDQIAQMGLQNFLAEQIKG